MRLRLYHHSDGARVAYREAGTGPPLALLHSGLLSHKEWEPAVAHLSDRFRVVLPDLPLHGDSEDRPRHPYTLDWFADVMAGFAAEVLGPRPRIAGHDAGAEILLHAVLSGQIRPDRLVLMPNRMHAEPASAPGREALRLAACAGAIPGLDLVLSHAAGALFTPARGLRLSARSNPQAADLFRHAFADVPGNSTLARSWAKCARAWPRGAQSAAAGAVRATGHAGAAAVGRPGPPASALDRRRGPAAAPTRAAARAPEHGLPDGL